MMNRAKPLISDSEIRRWRVKFMSDKKDRFINMKGFTLVFETKGYDGVQRQHAEQTNLILEERIYLVSSQQMVSLLQRLRMLKLGPRRNEIMTLTICTSKR